MSNFTKFLFVLTLLCCSLTGYSQAEILIQPTQADANPGDEVTVDVKMTGFVDLSGVQFSVDWNESLLAYDRVENFNPSLGLVEALNFVTVFTGDGKLAFTWNTTGSGVSLADTVTLFSIVLDVSQAAGSTSFLSITDDPFNREILQEQMGNTVDIAGSSTFTSGPATEAGYGSGPNPCDGVSGFTHVLTDQSVSSGNQVCVDVYGCGFDSIEILQYTIDYNPSLLRFDSVTNLNPGMPRLTSASFAHNRPPNLPLGKIFFSWPDTAIAGGISVPGEILYSLCFTAIGSEGTADTLEFIEFDNNEIEVIKFDQIPLVFNSSGGIINITGGGQAVSLGAGSANGNPGDEVCVDVTATNFTDLETLDFSMGWDPLIADFSRIINTTAFNGANAPTFDTSNALTDTGKLSFEWDNSGTPFSITDGTVLFQVCYDLVGNGGEDTDIDFTDDPVTSGATRDDGMGGTESSAVLGTSGNVSIIGSGTLQLFTIDTTAGMGDTICIPIQVRNFNDLLTAEFRLLWDTSIVQFVSSTIALPPSPTHNPVAEGYSVSWFDNFVMGVTIPDDSVILEICLEVVGETGEMSPLTFGGNIEFGRDSMGRTVFVPFALTNGSITVVDVDPLTVSDTTITDVACNGDATGAIDITVMGGESPYTFAWSNMETTEDITGLVAGDYTVTVTDMGGTTITETYTVGEPAALGHSFTITNVTCNGDGDGSIDLTPSGGTGAYTFAWSNMETTEDLSGLGPDDYTVTITDANGCTLVVDTTITEPTALGGTLTATNVVCKDDDNGSIDLAPTGGTGAYTYAWSNMETTEDISGLAPATYTVTITDANACTFVDSLEVTEPDAIVINSTTSGPGCNGDSTGTIQLAILGGTPPFVDFEWSFPQYNGMQNLSNLPAGTYTVTVTDNAGCTGSNTLIVLQPDLLALTGTATHETMPGANDGSIDLTVNGGVGPFTYNWTPDQGDIQDPSGLSPGPYTVTVVDANGCDATIAFTVNSADAPDIAVTLVTPVDCKGESTGAIDITVSSGTPNYTFAWSNGQTTEDVSNLPAGTYTVTVTDANMIMAVSQPIVVSEPTDALTASATSTNPSCANVNDGTISLNVSGGTGAYTFAWNNSLPAQQNQTGLAVGTYTCTVSDANGCTQVVTEILTGPPAVNVTNVNITEVVCNGASTGAIDITVSGGAAPYTYNWDDASGSATEDISNLPARDYNVTITDDNGCSFTFGPYTVTERTAMSLSTINVTDARCNGEPSGSIDIEVTGGTPPYTYAWENIDSSTGLGSTQDLTNLRGGNHRVTVTDNAGCTFVPTPIFVDEPAAIVANPTITDASAQNNDGAISTSATGGTAPYTYSWTGPNSYTSTASDINGLMPGCYFLTITDNRGCQETFVNLCVRGVVSFTGQVTDVTCNGGDDGAIDLAITAGISPFTFAWEGPNNFMAAIEDVSGLEAGNYTVTVTDNLGSTSTQTFTVDDAPPMELASVTVQDETGAGCNGAINIEITGGTLPLTYQWSNGATSEDITMLCKGDYSVTVIDDNGCTFIPGNFVVNPPPFLFSQIETTDVTCSNSNDGSICITVIGGCEPYTFTLDNSLGSRVITTDNQICYDDLAPSTYDVKVIDRFGTEIETPVTVEGVDPIQITVDQVQDNTNPACQSGNGSIQTTITGGTAPYTFQWSHDGSINSEDVTGLCHTLTYSLTVIDNNGCTQTVSGIEVDLGLSIQTNITNTCFGECDGTIDIQVTGGLPPYIYAWSDIDDNQDRAGLCAGIYTVTITDSNGKVLASNAIRIDEPAEGITITPSTIVNPSGVSSDGAISVDVTGGWGDYTYEWSGPNGFTSSSKNISGLSEGNYLLTVLDREGCSVDMSFTLVGERITVEIIEDDILCPGEDNGRLEAMPMGGTQPYTYDWSNSVRGAINSRLGAGTYTVTVTDVNGLTGTAEATLTEPAEIIISFADPTANTLQALPLGGTAPYVYQWNTDNRDSTPIISAECDRQYTVLVTDANGCTAFMVGEKQEGCNGDLNDCENVRKVITPNNDGNNDVFIIDCEGEPVLTLFIFNRYGQMVFESDNYDQTWDGTNERGNPLPEGGYFYILEYNRDGGSGEFVQEKGYVNIVR